MSQPLPHPANAPAVLLTGVTGSLGGQLLAGLLRAWPDHHVLAPLRAPTAEAAALRLREAADFAGLGPAERMRLHTFAADLSAPMLGLPLRAWQQLADCTRVIYHLAASVDFDLPLAESRRANVDSTAELLRLAQLCAARHASEFRFNHVSTAYICGRREGRLLESELGVGQSFWNGYEQSKLESEGLVRAVMGDLRATVYRPSQVVGDAARGERLGDGGCLGGVNDGACPRRLARDEVRIVVRQAGDDLDLDFVARGHGVSLIPRLPKARL